MYMNDSILNPNIASKIVEKLSKYKIVQIEKITQISVKSIIEASWHIFQKAPFKLC